jgi:hypothetical protein
MSAEKTIAVALHDVEPATFERCALIRDWLHDHGVDRVTLLVVPAADLHPFFQRRPDLAAWLLDCRDRGDTVAQHGFQRERARRPEFSGLCAEDTRASLEAGRKLLALAGVAPRGFVAPGYAYTPVLRRELAAGYDWWATMLRLVSRERDTLAPALSLRRSPLGVCARSTCTPWTSTARAACSRSRPSCAAPPAGAPSPTTNWPRRRLPPRARG